MVIDEDPFPPVDSINLVPFDLWTLINLKKARGIPPYSNIRKILIPKQYLIDKNDLTEKRRVFTTKGRKKNGRHPNHSFGENSMGLGQDGNNEKFLKEMNVSPKERHASPREKGIDYPSRRKRSPRFIIHPTISFGQE